MKNIVEANEVGAGANAVAVGKPEMPTVSIVTVTQYARHECLRNLERLIQKQMYPNMVEWVIVEGSKTVADAEANGLRINELKIELPINYIPFQPNHHLSDLRNVGNKACIGDIIVCMDDDDYYPPTRVTHAVYMLMNSPKGALIAGCSAAYIYFFELCRFFQFKSFGKTHSTNNCLAYKKEYLRTHSHAPGLDKAEESSFTNNFSEPMEQLDPMKTIVISGHGTNTVDKSWITLGSEPPKMAIEMNAAAIILDFIPLPILLKMEKIFGIN